MSLFERMDDPWWAATVLERLGSAAWTRNDLDQTKAFFQRSLAARRAIGDEPSTAGLLINLGALARFDGGQVDEAEALYRESSRLFATLGGRTGELSSLSGLQVVERFHGRFPQAREIIERQVAIASELGDRALPADLRMVLGEVLYLKSIGSQVRRPCGGRTTVDENSGDRSETGPSG